jgi:tRNA threonylcarbamoyladenosine biosynthesis protein TsaB
MKRLALDSSRQPTSLALQQGEKITPYEIEKQQAGAEELVTQIEQMMKKENINFDDLDEIIVASGPGPFIGLRIGLAAALGISVAANRPIKSIPSFAVLASFATTKNEDDIILVHQRARKDWTAFQTFNAKGEALSKLQCLPDEEFTQCFEKKNGLCFVPQKLPETLSARLIKLAPRAQAGAAPLYPPNNTQSKMSA